MKCLGFKLIRISKLVLPGGMPAVREELATADIQSSYEWTGGLPAEPVLVDVGLRLRAGKHRVAACMNLGAEAIPAMIFEGTEEELGRLTDIENAYRRHDTVARDAALARLVGHAVGPAVPEGGSSKGPPGRPLTPRGAAIREVAKATGSTPAAVASAVRRSEERTRTPREAEDAADVIVAPTACIATLGLSVPGTILAETDLEHEAMTKMGRQLQQLQGDLTRLEGEVGHQYQGLKSSLHDAAVACRMAMPDTVCLGCKLVEKVRAKCQWCHQKGWQTVGERKAMGGNDGSGDNLYEKLAATGASMGIYVDGEWKLMREARAL